MRRRGWFSGGFVLYTLVFFISRCSKSGVDARQGGSKESAYLIAIYPEQSLFLPRRERVSCCVPSTFGNDRLFHRPALFRRVAREFQRIHPLFLSAIKRVVVHGTRSPRRLVTRGRGLLSPLPWNFHIQIVLDIERMFQPNVREGGPLERASKRLRKIK